MMISAKNYLPKLIMRNVNNILDLGHSKHTTTDKKQPVTLP